MKSLLSVTGLILKGRDSMAEIKRPCFSLREAGFFMEANLEH